MTIRLAAPADLPALMPIYDSARDFMRRNGNLTQWSGGFPSEAFLLRRIQEKTLYVMEDGKVPFAVFALVPGDDSTYAFIEGEWHTASPYATIHQLASDGTHVGVLKRCVDFCRRQYDCLRIDTHEDNAVMRHLLPRYGFSYCGVIYLEDGAPRMAYDWKKLCD